MEGIKQIITEWNLAPLLKGDNDPQLEHKKEIIQKSHQEFVKKWKDRDDYLKSPEKLREALDDFNELCEKYARGGDPMFYLALRSSQDQIDPELKAKNNKFEEFSKKLGNDINFFLLRISKINPVEYEKFLSYPGLTQYRHKLERIFNQAKYLLTEEGEKIITLKANSAHEAWADMITSLMSKEERTMIIEEKKKVSFAEITALLNHKDKKVRDNAAKVYNEILSKYIDISEAEINAILCNKKVDDDLRKMPRPDFSRHLRDDINSKIVDVLINAVSKRFDISRKYYELKAKLAGVRQLEYHERNVNYGKIDKKYGYEEAINLVYKTFSDLDKEFADILKRFNDNGQIDVYPKKGKSSGAFCIYWNRINSVYVLLNFAGRIDDVVVIAHEFGHAINDEMMKKKQNALNYGTPTSTAEVASVFMEDFVIREVIKHADDELRLAILMERLNRNIATIQRQIACYMFEQELHKTHREKGYLSKDEIGKLFQKHMHAYMGEYVKQSPGSENWWSNWWHIRNFFYTYSYAFGGLISKSLQNLVKKDHKNIEHIKEFLSTGLSDSPRNIFMKMGIDITKEEFWNKGLDEIESTLNDAEKLAKKLGKI